MPVYSFNDLAASRERFRRWVAQDTTSGFLLVAAALTALIWANSPWSAAYASFTEFEIGPAGLHLHLSVGQWAADGLLAIFFFVVGVELKHEFVAGSLRQPRLAGVPIGAAVGGMIVPALVYLAIVGPRDGGGIHGWAIPTATDIAFALAVLAIFGRGLPAALRIFLLTLAVVDDLLGIIIIATVYTDSINIVMLGCSIATIAVFAILVRRRKMVWWLLIPLAFLAWALMHASGVHSTVAGVLLGFTVPAVALYGSTEPRTHRLDDVVRPLSAAVALPIFAFVSAGVPVLGGDYRLIQPVSVGIFCGLLFGKVTGVLGATFLMTRLTPLRLPATITLRDLLPIGVLTGVGFTVSLLIAELSFDDGPHADAAKVAILAGSVTAAVAAGVLLRWDARQARDCDDEGVAGPA